MQDIVNELNAHLQHMLGALEAERAALGSHDAEALAKAAERKSAVSDTLAELLVQHPECSTKLSNSAAGDDPRWSELRTRAEQVKEYNLVNGMILNRTQQSTRVLLGIISGKALHNVDGLYGQSGQQAASDGGGHALARA